ncbi:MAG: sulfatase-like hydrolase/transferase [Candidatus Aminicenantes bacterium]|nr:sulfatase-like hydrolase/transferase [Candidatus Aminicenantes bacterium]
MNVRNFSYFIKSVFINFKLKKRRGRKIFLRFVLLFSPFLFFFFFIQAVLYSSPKQDTSLNLLLITIDTLRADRLGCYGSKAVKTPHIDSLAAEGILFNRAFAHTSTTLPSHTNIMTGATPLYHGVHDNSNFIVSEDLLTLAEHLKRFGYSTGAVIGAYPLDVRFGLNQGFDFYDDDYGNQNFQNPIYVERRAEHVVETALEWMSSQKKPWFLWIHCFDPHFPYESPEPFKEEFKDKPYNGEVSYVDFSLGKLFVYLKNKNVFEKTVIIFTSDHGESLGEHGELTHGYFAYNTSIWVPLIIRIPGSEVRQIDQTVSHIDIFPTVCDILRIEKPAFLQGSSLFPMIQGKRMTEKPVYFESLYPYYSRGWAPIRGYISGKEKYISSPIPELYNLDTDFDEHNNLADRTELGGYQSKLDSIISNQSQPERKAIQRMDRETLKKLESLGYVSNRQVGPKENSTPDDDVKTLLPYHNRSFEAFDLYRAGKGDEAVRLLRKIITEKEDLDSAYLNLAKIFKETGEMKNALEVLGVALDNLPSSYEVFITYISYLLQAGQYDQVLKIFEKKEYHRMRFDPEIWNSAGVAYMNKGYSEKAIAAFRKAVSLDNDYPAAYNNLGNVYFFDSRKNKNPTSFQLALNNYKKAIELDPDYAMAYNGLGGAYLLGGHIEGAIFCLEKALELDPDLDYALYNLGHAYLRNGDKRKAVEVFENYKKKNYDHLSPSEQKRLDDLILKYKKISQE